MCFACLLRAVAQPRGCWGEFPAGRSPPRPSDLLLLHKPQARINHLMISYLIHTAHGLSCDQVSSVGNRKGLSGIQDIHSTTLLCRLSVCLFLPLLSSQRKFHWNFNANLNRKDPSLDNIRNHSLKNAGFKLFGLQPLYVLEKLLRICKRAFVGVGYLY